MSDTDTTDTNVPETSGGLAEQSAAATPITVTGATTYRGRRIRQLERECDELREVLHDVLTLGKSYQLSGSHAVTRADVPELEARLAAVNEELADLMLRRDYSPLRREPTKFY